MTDIKRNISDVGEELPYSGSMSPELHSDKKMHTKPGRKPIETEPKSKRTAQNRAAQRAYRERKERKMKDLEDKVRLLEEDNIKASTESDFLKAQVNMLKSELTRYRGHSDFSDLELPTKVGKLSQPKSRSYLPSFDSSSSVSTTKTNNSGRDVSLTSMSSENKTTPTSVDFPWSKDNLEKKGAASLSSTSSSHNYNNAADLVGSSSSLSSSPLNENVLVSPDSSVSSNHGAVNLQLKPDNFKEIPGAFNEQVDTFCGELNQVCGTKSRPVAKYNRNGRTSVSSKPLGDESIQNYNSPFSNLVTPNSIGETGGQTNSQFDYLNDPFFQPGNNGGANSNVDFNFPTSEDPLSFLDDNNFDVSLAFESGIKRNEGKEEVDPLAFLTTEESVYDPLNDMNNFNMGDYVKPLPADVAQANITVPTLDNDDDDNEVVPAPAETMKCSEIWDRIAAHPKYTEIDIDGLCNELKSKAKCSEKGVVIDSADVAHLLEHSTALKRV